MVENNYLQILDHMEYMTEDQLKGNVTIMKNELKNIDTTKRVYVYFNLHKKFWSVRQSGMVVAHCKHIMLKDCRFLVSQAGREKVIREKKKNVHAGVSGYVVDSIPEYKIYSQHKLTYNPYRYKGFVSMVEPDEGVVEYSHFADLHCGEGWRDVWAYWMVNNMVGVK